MEKPVTSLDLLEECLLTIYEIRKNSKGLKRNQLKAAPIEKGSGSENKKESARGPVAERKTSFQERERVISEAPSPSISRAASNLNDLPYLPRGSSKRDLTAATAATPSSSSQSKSLTGTATSSSSASSIPSAASTSSTMKGFASLDDQKHDRAAIEIFEAFKKEIRLWWTSNPTKRTDEDIRGDLADDLTERYLCQRLDPLPASRVVTNIRKTISTVIEDFASGEGTLPSDIMLASLWHIG
jgi:hypothetical protein